MVIQQIIYKCHSLNYLFPKSCFILLHFSQKWFYFAPLFPKVDWIKNIRNFEKAMVAQERQNHLR